LTLPPLSDSEGEYVQALAAIVREGRYEMLIPGSDQALRVVDTVDSG